MGVPTRDLEPMTAHEFFTFTETRPKEEMWELIEGEPVMNPTASFPHQLIVRNLLFALMQREMGGSWIAIPGIGVELSATNVPVPDVLVRPRDLLRGWKCDDMIVGFEVLSPSTQDRDLRWKRAAYATLPSLQHYVVVAQDAPEIAVYDRASGFAERRFSRFEDVLDLAALGASLPLAEIYRDTGFAPA